MEKKKTPLLFVTYLFRYVINYSREERNLSLLLVDSLFKKTDLSSFLYSRLFYLECSIILHFRAVDIRQLL